MLFIVGEIEWVDRRGIFVLIGELKTISFIYFEVAIEWSRNESRSIAGVFHPAYHFFVVLGWKKLLTCPDIIEGNFVTSSCDEGEFGGENINTFERFIMMKLHLSWLMNSEIKEANISIVSSCENMVILDNLNVFNVVWMGVLIGMNNISGSHIKMSQDKIITTWV